MIEDIKIICLESVAFYALVNEVVDSIKTDQNIQHDKWINDNEAMSLLRITSKTTLQNYRDEGVIRYTQPTRKLILYDRDSILNYLESHAKDTF
ncbi:MAG TPA: helix-turn-helix domain-containing protein [Saprospiraceae bacterium]|nr:helix-turn-helix domain-containing protein [Saprospiraceae bacterium]